MLTGGGVSIAGNLSPKKCAYLTELKRIPQAHFDLYGPGYDKDATEGENVTYHGSFQPEELPHRLESGFGLVWDGDSVETCEGQFGKYLAYNSPHKLSLYLAAGLPVIIWKGAAQSDFVEKNGLGFSVGSLKEIPSLLSGIKAEDYEKLLRNVCPVSEKLRAGHYLKAVLSEAEKQFSGRPNPWLPIQW